MEEYDADSDLFNQLPTDSEVRTNLWVYEDLSSEEEMENYRSYIKKCRKRSMLKRSTFEIPARPEDKFMKIINRRKDINRPTTNDNSRISPAERHTRRTREKAPFQEELNLTNKFFKSPRPSYRRRSYRSFSSKLKKKRGKMFETIVWYPEILSPISSDEELESKTFHGIMHEGKEIERKLKEKMQKRLHNYEYSYTEVVTCQDSSQEHEILLPVKESVSHKKYRERKLQPSHEERSKELHNLLHQHRHQEEEQDDISIDMFDTPQESTIKPTNFKKQKQNVVIEHAIVKNTGKKNHIHMRNFQQQILSTTIENPRLRSSPKNLELEYFENIETEPERIIWSNDRTKTLEAELLYTDLTTIEKPIFDQDQIVQKPENMYRNCIRNRSSVLQTKTFKIIEKNYQPIGLKNPPGTNKCWMNASLQAILEMTLLIDDILKFVSNCEISSQGGKYCHMLNNFIDVIKAKQNNNKYQLHDAVHEFHKSLKILSAQFTSYEQQDATEFMTYFFSALMNEFNTLKISCQLNNPITENITFKLEETYSCKKCRILRSKVSSNNIMSINIDSQKKDENVELEKLVEVSMMTEIREYNCEYCDSQQIEVTTRFVSLSKFLLLQLNRFICVSNSIEKSKSNVRIPEVLILKNFVNTKNLQFPEKFPLSYESHNHNYHLIGMISHIGERISSGHYIADVYNMKTKTWINYNDEFVRKTEICNFTKDGYVFVYMYKPLFNKLS
ncbi:hypothetical protein C0J52_27000 [Blattella germanica]|nr:hypothetical protein C0J52_27000 [Blattella germanica]